MMYILRAFLKVTAAALLILFSLHHSYDLLKESRTNFKLPAEPDSVAVFEKRFAALKLQLVQTGSTQVGYVTDIPENDVNWFREYFRTQYVLAPVVVHDSTEPSVVVANLRNPSAIASILRERRLSVVSDFGDGVVLLSRQPR
jgi:hypothetical protein